jgi:hypothetical protein
MNVQLIFEAKNALRKIGPGAIVPPSNSLPRTAVPVGDWFPFAQQAAAWRAWMA